MGCIFTKLSTQFNLIQTLCCSDKKKVSIWEALLLTRLVAFVFIMSCTSALADPTLSNRYNSLKAKLSKANTQQAVQLIPHIQKLQADVRSDKAHTEVSLKKALKDYEETYDLIERLNPWHQESSNCVEQRIDPLKQTISKEEQLYTSIETLLLDAKIKGELLGDYRKCGTSCCKAFLKKDPKVSTWENCTGMMTGDPKACWGEDCKAYVTGNINKCYTSDCKAYMSGDINKCRSGDCKAYLSNDSKKCYSADCKAYVSGDIAKCYSSDCKAYLSSGKHVIQLKVKVKIKPAHLVPLALANQEKEHQDQE